MGPREGGRSGSGPGVRNTPLIQSGKLQVSDWDPGESDRVKVYWKVGRGGRESCMQMQSSRAHKPTSVNRRDVYVTITTVTTFTHSHHSTSMAARAPAQSLPWVSTGRLAQGWGVTNRATTDVACLVIIDQQATDRGYHATTFMSCSLFSSKPSKATQATQATRVW
jgi:hypothetical protein